MLDIRFRGAPYAMVRPAVLPVALNTGLMPQVDRHLGVPDFPVQGLWWSPKPVVWAPIRPQASRHHLTVVK